jgi:hypothetical protein
MGTRKYPPSKTPAGNLAGSDYLRKGSTIHETCGEERILRQRLMRLRHRTSDGTTDPQLFSPDPAFSGILHALCGEERIRTSDRGISPYNGLANRRLRPLGHLSINPGRKFDIMITKEPYRIKGVTTAKAKNERARTEQLRPGSLRSKSN